LIFSLLLLFVALAGLGKFASRRDMFRLLWMPVVLAILAVISRGQALKSNTGQIYEAESAYNYIQVAEQNGFTILRLNEGQGVHSVYTPHRLESYGPWMQFLAAPFFNALPYEPGQVENMAIVGLAAGTLARQATAVFGPIPIDGFEIDPEIIAVGREFFDMNQPNLNAIAQDGRWGLERSGRQYSLIAVDAYRPPYIPWHLTTREFFESVRAHLAEGGVAVINVGRAPDDRRLVDGMAATMKAVFPSVYVMDVPNTFNTIIYATVQPTALENLYANLVHLSQQEDTHPLLLEAMQLAALNMQPVPEGGTVFTDDLAPIEWITNNMVLRFVLFGDKEVLQ
jgi:spermidine synthase